MDYIITDFKDNYKAYASSKGLAMANAINHCVVEGLTVIHVQENGPLTTIWYIDPDNDDIYTIYIKKSV